MSADNALIGLSEVIVTLVVGALASSVLAEMVKRSNRRASILTDLEIWEELPDGATKTMLFDAVTAKVRRTALRPKWPAMVTALAWWAMSTVLVVITFGITLQRDSQGVMRAVGYEFDYPLSAAVIGTVVYGYMLVVCGVAGSELFEKFDNWLSARRLRSALNNLAKLHAPRFSRHPAVVQKAKATMADPTADEADVIFARAIVEAVEKLPDSETGCSCYRGGCNPKCSKLSVAMKK